VFETILHPRQPKRTMDCRVKPGNDEAQDKAVLLKVDHAADSSLIPGLS
jgi:hypothetical protein